MLGIHTVGAVSFDSQIFYFPMKLWVQMLGAAKLQKHECVVCFKTQIDLHTQFLKASATSSRDVIEYFNWCNMIRDSSA